MGQTSHSTIQHPQNTGKYVEPSLEKELGGAIIPPNLGTFAIPQPKEVKRSTGPLNYKENPNYSIKKDVGGGEIKPKNGGWTTSTNLYSPENIKKYTNYGFTIEDALKIIAAQNPGTINPTLVTENIPKEEETITREAQTAGTEAVEQIMEDSRKSDVWARNRLRDLLGKTNTKKETGVPTTHPETIPVDALVEDAPTIAIPNTQNEELVSPSRIITREEILENDGEVLPNKELSDNTPYEEEHTFTKNTTVMIEDELQTPKKSEPLNETNALEESDVESSTIPSQVTAQETHKASTPHERKTPFEGRLGKEFSPTTGENAEILTYRTEETPSRIQLPQEKAAMRNAATAELMKTFEGRLPSEVQGMSPSEVLQQKIMRLSNPLLITQIGIVPKNIPTGLETKKITSWKESLEEDTDHILKKILSLSEKELITKYVPLYVDIDNPSSWAAVSAFSAHEILNGDENVYSLKHNEGARVEISTLIKHLGLIDEASDALSDNPKYINSTYLTYEDYLSKNPKITIHDYYEEIRRKATEANMNEKK